MLPAPGRRQKTGCHFAAALLRTLSYGLRTTLLILRRATGDRAHLRGACAFLRAGLYLEVIRLSRLQVLDRYFVVALSPRHLRPLRQVALLGAELPHAAPRAIGVPHHVERVRRLVRARRLQLAGVAALLVDRLRPRRLCLERHHIA